MKSLLGHLVRYGWLYIIAIFVLYLVGLLAVTSPLTKYQNLSFQQIGALGDSFGPVTAFFTALAFWAAMSIIFEQRKELNKLQYLNAYSNQIQRAALQPVFSISIFSESDLSNYFKSFMLSESRYVLESTNGLSFYNVYAENNENGVTSIQVEKNRILLQHKPADINQTSGLSLTTQFYVFYTDLTGYKTKITLGLGVEWQKYENEVIAKNGNIDTIIVDRDEHLEILSIDFIGGHE